MTEKKFELSTHSRMPHMSCKICHFFRDTGTFEYYYHTMKGNEEDDDNKPNSANGSTPSKDFHVKLDHQPNCSSSQSTQVREAAYSREFTSLQNSYVSRSFSERIYFHIGGF